MSKAKTKSETNVEVTEEVVNNETATTKKQTWFNRIWSAAVGAVVAVGAMFGITQPQIEAQKAKVIEVKNYATEALEAIKKGDVQTATAKLQEATAATKEVAEQVKKDVEKLKATDKNSVIENVKKAATEALVKDQVKKTEAATKAYADDAKTAPTTSAPVTDATTAATK